MRGERALYRRLVKSANAHIDCVCADGLFGQCQPPEMVTPSVNVQDLMDDDDWQLIAQELAALVCVQYSHTQTEYLCLVGRQLHMASCAHAVHTRLLHVYCTLRSCVRSFLLRQCALPGEHLGNAPCECERSFTNEQFFRRRYKATAVSLLSGRALSLQPLPRS